MSGLRDAHLKGGSKNVCPQVQPLSADSVARFLKLFHAMGLNAHSEAPGGKGGCSN